MNRLVTPAQNTILIPEHVSLADARLARRLIVLIPADVDCSAINHQIWKLARESNSVVQLLALYKDPEQELTLRRELATMSALIQDATVPVEISIERGTNWVAAVKHHYQHGDMVVSVAEQHIGLQRKPLTQILESDLKIPLYILSGLPLEKPQGNGLKQITAWLGFMGIIAGFFALQWKVTQLQNDSLQTILLIALLISEFWLIGVWNSLFS